MSGTDTPAVPRGERQRTIARAKGGGLPGSILEKGNGGKENRKLSPEKKTAGEP